MFIICCHSHFSYKVTSLSFVLLLHQHFFLHQLDGLNHVRTVIKNDQLHLLSRYTTLSKRVFQVQQREQKLLPVACNGLSKHWEVFGIAILQVPVMVRETYENLPSKSLRHRSPQIICIPVICSFYVFGVILCMFCLYYTDLHFFYIFCVVLRLFYVCIPVICSGWRITLCWSVMICCKIKQKPRQSAVICGSIPRNSSDLRHFKDYIMLICSDLLQN